MPDVKILPADVDTTGWDEQLGMRFDPATGEAFISQTYYDKEDVEQKRWLRTGLFFEMAWVVGPGFYQPYPHVPLAHLQTAQAMQGLLTQELPAKVTITSADWGNSVVLIDPKTQMVVPMRMLSIEYAGKTTRLNAGIEASNMVRTTVDFYISMLRSELI